MFKRAISLFIGLLVWVGVSAVAQEADWFAWLYNRDAGQMIQVNDQGGTVRNLTLPLVMAHDRYSYNVAISHSARLIAYTVYSTSMFTTQLLIYDTLTGELTATYSPGRIIGDSIDFVGSSDIFNDFDTALAYGYRAEEDGWKVVVLDLVTGSEVFALHADDPVVKAAAIPAEFGYIPVVRRYKGVEITFTMVSSGSEGQPEYRSYTWNPVFGTIQTSLAFPGLFADTFQPTGEIVSPALDSRLASQVAALPIPYQLNTVQVYDPTTGGRFPFYTDPNLTINSAHFIQNGQRVLINAFNVTSEDPGDPRFWAVLERSGVVAAYAPLIPPDSLSVAGVADGFIFTSDSGGAGSMTSLMHVKTDDNSYAGHVVWSGEPGASYRIVGAQDNRATTASAQAVSAWAQLAPPVFAPTSGGISPAQIPTVTPFVAAPPRLTVGGTAVVNTTEGDLLNVRSGPGRNFDIVTKVKPGSAVIILEGPRAADGYTWWRIRAPDGKEGWAVESADGVRTLLP